MNDNSLAGKFKNYINSRNILFLFFTAVAFIVTYFPIRALYSSDKSEYYSHITLIPLVTIYLLFIKRKVIFADVNYLYAAGISVLLLGIILFTCGMIWGPILG